MEPNNRVLLAMSGGTDSSVAAMLLLEQGFDVKGITFLLAGTDSEPEYMLQARELASKLNIEHYSLDLRQQFKHDIIDYFTEEYLQARTPNPCVKCNNQIKWPMLIALADRLNCQWVATGHYVKVSLESDHYFITKADDRDKDQSFFLWGLDQATLSRAIFPLGDLLKSEVRAIALERGFTKVSQRKDSMGVCFLPGSYKDFIESNIEVKMRLPGPGRFTDEQNSELGEHHGYPFYTIGQRRGLGLDLNRPLYVTAILPETNKIVLGSREDLLVNRIRLSGCNFVDQSTLNSQKFIVQIRYRKQATLCQIKLTNENECIVELDEAIVKEANGQTATFYLGDKVTGGGWIEDSWIEK